MSHKKLIIINLVKHIIFPNSVSSFQFLIFSIFIFSFISVLSLVPIFLSVVFSLSDPIQKKMRGRDPNMNWPINEKLFQVKENKNGNDFFSRKSLQLVLIQ